MLEVARKLTKLLESEPDSREGAGGRREFNRTKLLMRCPPTVGVVTDNRDPDCLGRIRLSYDTVVPGSVSPWLPVIGQGRGKGKGMWTLPEIGTQALAVFTAEDRSRGYVLGFIYDREHHPPESGTEKKCDSTLLQTRTQRIEVTDKEGSEEIRIESAEGRMRVSIGKFGGINVENELGGINIKCKNLKCEGEAEVHFATKKAFTLTTDDTLKINPKGNVNITSDKEVKLKGKNIKMSGSKGVVAEGKQIAVQDDKVMGFDTHIMVVPSGNGTTTVPLPHPFIGKISDKLSEDVKIGNKGAAVKGSKAKHNDSMHLQLPGTITFQTPPKKEGEVTGGTVSKVKIDGKEAAVIGSQVTTCNDMGMQNNSVIMAAGMSIPMPAIVNPLNNEERKREREESQKKEPKFSSVKWAKTSCKEGEEIELSAGVKDIADGNMVTLQVFREGQSPEDSAAIAKFPLTVKGGSVFAKWSYRRNGNDIPPERNPRFIFSAHSAWCPWKKSENSLEVQLIRPEITKTEWRDEEGKAVSKGKVGHILKLYAQTKDMEDGTGITFRIYDDKKREITSIGAEVKDGTAETVWTYYWNGEDLKEKPKFTFEVTGQRCKNVESKNIELGQNIDIQFAGSRLEKLGNIKVSFFREGEILEKESSDGSFTEEDLIPEDWKVKLVEIAGKDKMEYLADDTSVYEIVKTNYFHMIENGIPCIAGKKQLIIIDFYAGISE